MTDARALVRGGLALAVIVGAPAPSAGAPCNGVGVAATIAEARENCCPARNHGAYVSCAAHVSNRAVAAGRMQASCKVLVLKAGCMPASTTTSTTHAPTTSTTRLPASTTSTTHVTSTSTTSLATTTTATTHPATTSTTPHGTTSSTMHPTTSTTAQPSTTTSTTTAGSSTTSSTGPTGTSTTAPASTTTSTTGAGGTTTSTMRAGSTTTSTTAGGSTTTSTMGAASTTTSTTAGGSTTTSTTLLSRCGNGNRDPGEECDPALPNPGCPPRTVCGTVGTPQQCRCVPPSPERGEICGNCIDDDGNGLTDFEDPACCPRDRSFVTTVRQLRIRPRGITSRLRLRSTLADKGLADVDPLTEDVFVQIRPAGGRDILCAKVPAIKFMHMHHAFLFWDHAHETTSAKGIDDLAIRIRPDGSVRLRAHGKRVQMPTPAAGQLQVTTGFRNPAHAEGANRCTSGVANFP